MSSTVAMFPGQGLGPRDISRAEVADVLPDLVEQRDELLGCDPHELDAWPTSIAQPMAYCASLARWVRDWEDEEPECVAGHSLGEITALAAAGGVSPADGLDLVVERGRLTEQAVSGTRTGMLAVGVRAEEGEKLAARAGAVLANDNSPDQVVLSGLVEDLEVVARLAREANVRTHRLAVAGAFHSQWVSPAVEPFRERLRRTRLTDPRIRVISSVTCAPMRDPVSDLTAALTSRVRWRELVLSLHASGIDDFRDVGPGAALQKLARHTLAGVEALA